MRDGKSVDLSKGFDKNLLCALMSNYIKLLLKWGKINFVGFELTILETNLDSCLVLVPSDANIDIILITTVLL